MAYGPDQYSIPVDFRITQTPQPVADQKSKFNFEELFDFAVTVIRTFVQFCGIGTYDTSQWPLLAKDPSQLQYAGNLRKVYCTASVAITAGQLVNFFLSGGLLQARLASSTSSTTRADGHCTANVASGAVGQFIMMTGVNANFTGLTLGQRYWLSSTPGNYSLTPDTATGHIEQYIGISLDTTSVVNDISYYIQH